MFLLLLAFIAGGTYYLGINKDVVKYVPPEINHIPSSTPSPKPVSIILAGDVMLGRSVTIESLDKQKNPKYPFLKVADVFRQVDIVFVNLENPVVENCPRVEHGFTFCSPPQMLEGLSFSGVNVVTIANNHSLNFGPGGFEETKRHLNTYAIDAVGYGNLVIRKLGNTSIGFLGFDFLSSKPTTSDFNLIKQSNGKVDILIVGVHWGVEYESEPREFQREWARQMVRAGVDVISGHHPHWVQSDEVIDGVPVYYSLGNFVFDQMWSEETKKGMLVELLIQNGEIKESNRMNTYISNWAQPEVVD